MISTPENFNKQSMGWLLILSCIFGFLIGYNYKIITIKEAYNYIIDHPEEYKAYILDSYLDSKEKLAECLDNNTCKLIESELKFDNNYYKTQKLTKYEISAMREDKRDRLQQLYKEHYMQLDVSSFFIDNMTGVNNNEF